jgi:hypothetical protein
LCVVWIVHQKIGGGGGYKVEEKFRLGNVKYR